MQGACLLCGLACIVGVVDPVSDRHNGEVEGADALKAGNIDSMLAGIRTAVVVGINPAPAAKKMLHRAGIETVMAQDILSFGDLHTAGCCHHNHGTPHPTIRACAAPDRFETVAQGDCEAHRATVARAAEYPLPVFHRLLPLSEGAVHCNGRHSLALRQTSFITVL